MKKTLLAALLALGVGACTQTQERTATGAVVGGAAGAAVGGLATGRAEGALAGGAIGAAGGAIIGNATAPQRQCYRDVYGRRYCEAY